MLMAAPVAPLTFLPVPDTNDKVRRRQKKVLERIEWLNYLRLIFNRAARDPTFRSSAQSITVEAFLNTLLESVESLPLQEESEFQRKSTVQYLSFGEVFTAFEQEFGKSISWDFVLEKVITMEGGRKEEESPLSIDVNELVAIARKSTSSPEPKQSIEEPTSTRRRPTYLRIPSTPNSQTSREFSNLQDFMPVDTIPLSDEDAECPSPLLTSYNRFPRSPDLNIPERNTLACSYSRDWVPRGLADRVSALDGTLTSLSLAGCNLEEVPTGLPSSLKVLNLAENLISHIDRLDGLRYLHLLNLSFNRLESLSGLYRLRNLFELYLSCNAISKVSRVFQLQNLALLDLGQNRIASMEDIIDLVQNRHLVVLRLSGNPIYKKLYSQAQIKSALPSVTYLDPPHMLDHSAYRQLGETAFGRCLLKRPVTVETSLVEKSVTELSPTAQKCAKRLATPEATKSLRTSANFSLRASQSLRSSTVRLY